MVNRPLHHCLVVLLTSLLFTAPVSAAEIDEDLLHQLDILSALSTQQDGIFLREELTHLESISGTTSSDVKSIWGFLIDEKGTVQELGEYSTRDEGSFTIPISKNSLRNLSEGELTVVISQLPELTLASLLPKTSSIVKIPFKPGDKVKEVMDSISTLLSVYDISFFSDQEELMTRVTNRWEVGIEENTRSIDLKISGAIFEGNENAIRGLSTVIPDLIHNEQIIQIDNDGNFIHRISVPVSETSKEQEVILSYFQNDQRLQELKIPLTLSPNKAFPGILDQSLQILLLEPISLILLAVLIFMTATTLLFWKNRGWEKNLLASFFLIFSLLFTFKELSHLVISHLVHAHILKLPGQQVVIQQTQPLNRLSVSLTAMDQDLNLIPAVSSHWSNIRPTIWEFVLRDSSDFSSKEIIQDLTANKEDPAEKNPYLDSVQQIIAINRSRLQFITRFPDPLLPQKLSRIPLPSVQQSLSQQNVINPYASVLQTGNLRRLLMNPNHTHNNFLENQPISITEIVDTVIPSQKRRLERQSIDILRDPSPAIWPTLFQKNYNIIPSPNTKSLFLAANRKEGVFSNSESVHQLRSLLQTGAVLQTSYLQYGQLANQFAPPGVTGYIEELEQLSLAPEALKIDELSFHYPSTEVRLAEAISKSLEQQGTIVNSLSYDPSLLSQHLEKFNPDLLLLDLDFELGDIGPFLDTFVDSDSSLNKTYSNERVDQLIRESRQELQQHKRLELLQEISRIIVQEDPYGVPLLFKRSFKAQREEQETSWKEDLLLHIYSTW